MRVNLNLVSLPNSNDEAVKTPLYPYHSTKLKVMLVYGVNMKREKYKNTQKLNSSSSLTASILINLNGILSAALLCFIRRRNRLRRDGFISSMIDVHIAFVGGGNLRVHDKYERWLIGILLIGNFILAAFWYDAVLYPMCYTQNRSIKTFDELSKMNPPIFISASLMKYDRIIKEMLR